MTKEKSIAELRAGLEVMSAGDAKHWYQPTTLLGVAAQPNLMWLQDRIWSRPGDVPGRSPVHVIGRAADYANHGITSRLTPLLGYLGAQGFLPRSWTVGHSWMTQGLQSADWVELRPALFGYADGVVVDQLHEFAWKHGYGILDRPSAESDEVREGPAPHLYVGGELRPSGLVVGTQRTADDIDIEWAGCNPAAKAALAHARQITLYDPERDTRNRFWADLAGHFGILFMEGPWS